MLTTLPGAIHVLSSQDFAVDLPAVKTNFSWKGQEPFPHHLPCLLRSAPG